MIEPLDILAPVMGGVFLILGLACVIDCIFVHPNSVWTLGIFVTFCGSIILYSWLFYKMKERRI